MLSENPPPVYLKDYRPPEFLVDRADLVFHLGEPETVVYARLEVRRNPASAGSEGGLRLNGEGLDLLELRVDGHVLPADAYARDEQTLSIPGVPDRCVIETEVSIRPQDNTELEGLYLSNGMFCTQCEAEGFRKITYFPDRPDVMARFSTRITATRDKHPVLLSNGNLMESRDLGDGRHEVLWEDPFPKPCYLFALVAGDLVHAEDRFTTMSGREVILRVYVEPENADSCAHALRSLGHAMAWDEQAYGREYDLDLYNVVAVNDFNMGAMENKGLNIFNSKYVLARPETATDRDFQGIEGVIAHEYFHNWTGNRITCRDWFQLSLKEGFTVFRDQEFSADMGSRGVKRIEDVRLFRATQFAEDAGPMAHPVRPESYIEINNFYTVTVYEKGAEVVRMQANLLGPELFRKATDLYFVRYDGQAVTTDDFVGCMEAASGRDLEQFRLWYSQAGTPELRVSDEYDARSRSYVLRVEQSCPPTPGQRHKQPFHIPLRVGLLGSGGEELPLRLDGERTGSAGSRLLELRGHRETFRFLDVPERPIPSLLRGFSAPVKVRYEYSDEDLMFLMAHDSDDFNRWDASQTLVLRVLMRMIEARRLGRAMVVPPGFVAALQTALRDPGADRSLLSEILSLPGESYIGDQMDQVDVEGIHQAREELRDELAGALKADFLRLYLENAETGAYAIDPVSIGRRSLKNLSLGYLVQRGEPEARELCARQAKEGGNMTDVVAALSALANCDCPERGPALDAFDRQWRDDALVMDKWFSIQAMSKLPGTLDRVKRLMEHPVFSIRNPNKVRSLIGAFCSANPAHFHADDGSGYRFLAERVLELDGLNPQVASRLLRGMTRWRRYDDRRKGMMQAELQRILAFGKLSRDVYEIAAKSLEET